MKRTILAAGLIAAGLIPPLQAALAEPQAEVSQLLVAPSAFQLAHAPRLGPGELAPFVQAAGVALEHVRSLGAPYQLLRLPKPVSEAEAQRLAARLIEAGVALSAAPDRRVQARLVPNDPLYAEQWHFQGVLPRNYGINLPGAWDVTGGSPDVVVALIDTGIRPHVDIDTDIQDGYGRVTPGFDFVTDPWTANDGDGRDADPSDPGDFVSAEDPQAYACPPQESSWHGTHLAGLLAAASNNAQGVAGIDWQARLLPVRVLGRCGGLESDVIDGMRWAVGLSVPDVPQNLRPARVLNMSFSSTGICGQPLQDTIDAVRARGAAVVVAAGNEGGSADSAFPGNCRGVINVTATTRRGDKAYYSNTGATVSLAAPGGDALDGILSTSNSGTTVPEADNYAWMAGTSMAAAHVTGVASLMFAVQPALSPDALASLLRSTATPFPADGGCTPSSCGTGIVNAAAAVRAAAGLEPLPAEPVPSEPAPVEPAPTEPLPSEPVPEDSGGGGGGAGGLLSLAGLAALALWRRRQGLARDA